MGIFRFFLFFLDKTGRDKFLEQYIGKDYKKNLDILGLNMFLLLFTLVCFGALYFIYGAKPSTDFYSWDGKTKQSLVTLNQPILSSDKIQNWTNDALKNIFSFNFYNMDNKMAQNEVYFTSDGWSAFQNALESSQVLKNVREKSLEVWLTPLGSAKMVSRNVVGDYIIWTVEMPAIITYRGAAPVQSSRVLISTTIITVPTTENPNGIEISQIMVHQNT